MKMKMKVATLLTRVVLVLCCGCINAQIDQKQESCSSHANALKDTHIARRQERSLTLTSDLTVNDETHVNIFKHDVDRVKPNYPITAATLQKCVKKCENNGHCCGNRLKDDGVLGGGYKLLSCANGCEIAFYVPNKFQCKSHCANGNEDEDSTCIYDPPGIFIDFFKCGECRSGCSTPISENECSNGCAFANTLDGFYDLSSSDMILLTSECTKDDPCGYYFQGIFAILWDINKYGNTFRKDAEKMGDILSSIRNDMQNEFQMEDPEHVSDHTYVNIFVHGSGDKFQETMGGGAGVGTDPFGHPFMMLPKGSHLTDGYLEHEAWHIFQYASKNFKEADARWYIESTAEWYHKIRVPSALHGSAASFEANPHCALWQSDTNGPPGENNVFIYGVRQYTLGSFLWYLTEIANIPRSKITSSFYSSEVDLPQQYLFEMIGSEKFRTVYADWAAHNVNNFDYLREEDVEMSRDIFQDQLGDLIDPADIQPYAKELKISKILGTTQRPKPAYQPRGWAYNVIKLSNSVASTYYIQIDGEEKGDKGAKSHFEGRIVIMGNRPTRFISVNMKDGLTGASTVSVTKADKEIFLIIAAVPNFFRGNQKYGYSFMIDDSPSPPVSNPTSPPATAPTSAPDVEVKKKYKYDTAIDVVFNNPGPPTSTDFVGLYEAPPGNVPLNVLPSLDLRFWQYTCGTGQEACRSNSPQSGTLKFDVTDPKIEDDSYWPPPPGKYRVCLGKEGSIGDVIIGKCQSFKVATPQKKVTGNRLKLKPKGSYKYGNVITIQYTWPFPTRNAWVGLYRFDGSKPQKELEDTDWWVYAGCNNQSGDQSESDDCSKVKKKGIIKFQSNDISVGVYYICLSIYTNEPYTKFKCSKTFEIKT